MVLEGARMSPSVRNLSARGREPKSDKMQHLAPNSARGLPPHSKGLLGKKGFEEQWNGDNDIDYLRATVGNKNDRTGVF